MINKPLAAVTQKNRQSRDEKGGLRLTPQKYSARNNGTPTAGHPPDTGTPLETAYKPASGADRQPERPIQTEETELASTLPTQKDPGPECFTGEF